MVASYRYATFLYDIVFMILILQKHGLQNLKMTFPALNSYIQSHIQRFCFNAI